MMRGRYDGNQQKNHSMNDNYKVMKQYGEKRLSSELLTTTSIPLQNHPTAQGIQKMNHQQQVQQQQQASIKIQIEQDQ